MFGLNKVRSHLSTSKYITTKYHEKRLLKEFKKQGSPILIYQMGKVGSTAIANILHEKIHNRGIYHFHFLSESTIADARKRLDGFNQKYNANAWCLYESEYVRDRYVTNIQNHFLDIISLVRDPVSRNFSSYFYNIKKYMPGFLEQYQSGSLSTGDVLNSYLENFQEHQLPLEWFDLEMNSVFGIDIFDSEFDKEKGCQVYHQGDVRLLLLRLDKLDKYGAEMFNEFLGLEDVSFSRANSSDERDYKEIYKKFVREVKVPQDYLDSVYQSKFSSYFFTPEEIVMFNNRWAKP